MSATMTKMEYPSGGESEVKPILLWENANPTSNFSAQTISIDISKYNAVIIELQSSKNQNFISSRVLAFKTDTTTEFFGGGNTSGAYSRSRNFKISDSGVVFENGNLNGGGNAEVAIPYKIFGLNITL